MTSTTTTATGVRKTIRAVLRNRRADPTHGLDIRPSRAATRPQQGYPPPPEQGGYPDQGGYPEQRRLPRAPGGYPEQPGGYPEQRGYPDQAATPSQGGYPDQRGYQDQRGYPEQGQGGYPPSYEQRPAGAWRLRRTGLRPGLPPGRRLRTSWRRPAGRWPAGLWRVRRLRSRTGRPARGWLCPAGPRAQPEQRPAYPEQGGGYDQGYQQGGGYGRQDYGPGDYTQYAENVPAGGYAPQGGGYPETANRDYDYGQPADYAQPGEYGQPGVRPACGYGGYGQGGYGSAGTAVTLQLDDGSGRTYQLRDGSNIVGRGQDAQFRLPDTGVSRRHLEIRWDGQVALLSDLNSTNGTTVNNAPVQEWQLADGDVIRLGHSEIIVRIH